MKIRKLLEDMRGQIIAGLVGVMLLIIVAVAIALPTIQDCVDTAGLGGIPGVIVGFLGLIVACFLLYYIAAFTSG